MNSKERHQARYERRKAKREAKKQALLALYTDSKQIFTLDNLYASAKKCCKGVGWKASIQTFRANMLFNCVKLYNQIHSGTFKSRGFNIFTRCERGKVRLIKSVHITERVVQRCLCDYSLMPLVSNSLIFDNGACQKGKGVDFAKNRFVGYLQQHFEQYGAEGYALTFDFSKYFDRIDHAIAKELVKNIYADKDPASLVCTFIDNFGDAGLGLGSQVSQCVAIGYPNRLDHYLKEVSGIKAYIRYMDDGVLVHHSKEHLQECLTAIRRLCDELHITVNEKKTQISKLSSGVIFLKTRFALTDTGSVLRLPDRKRAISMRRKLKTFRAWLDNGYLTFDSVLQSYNSWLGYMRRMNAHRVTQSMTELFENLYKEYITMEFFDPKTKGFFPQQDKAKSRIFFDKDKMDGLYARAKKGEIVDVSGEDFPEFIDKEYVQITLLNAARDALMLQGKFGDKLNKIDQMLAKYAPADEEEATE